MIPLMVKEADLNRIEVPEDYEVLDATIMRHSPAKDCAAPFHQEFARAVEPLG